VILKKLDDDDDGKKNADRSKRLRVAAMLKHPTARRVVALGLDESPAFVALEPAAPAAEIWARYSRAEAAELARELACGLSEAHRLGIAHGRLAAGVVATPSSRFIKIDWSGCSAASANEEALDSLSIAPELATHAVPEPAADIYALGSLLEARTASTPESSDVVGAAKAFDQLVASMRAADPADRPTASEVAESLATTLGAATIAHDNLSASPGQGLSFDHDASESLAALGRTESEPNPTGMQLGRFVLKEKLGQGGMGAVFRGEDLADGSTVAIKILRGSSANRPEALRRFYKEARLLAEAKNPHITNLIEVNEDRGIHYIVLELVRGTDLGRWLESRGRLDERSALSLLADAARGLSLAHARGIIHRDIKPENILLVDDDSTRSTTSSETICTPAATSALPTLKLADFGLARHVEETESLNLTQTGAILGTPLYMAPEQCSGAEALTPAADIYSLGAMLFRMLAGRPVFVGGSAIELINKHQHEAPPSLKAFNPEVSDAVCELVSKALAKRPEHRYRDASEMLDDLERLLRGEPSGITIHPSLPKCDPRELVRFDFEWALDASPAQLWPYVSNTERINRAFGLPAVPFTAVVDPNEGVKRFGTLKTAGMTVRWREHPFEWIEGTRMGVLREFSHGPFRWFVSVVELIPREGGGTLLRHGIRVAVKGLLGRTVAHVKLGNAGGRSMDRVYRRIDAVLTGKLGDGGEDPFEPPNQLSSDRRGRLDRWITTLSRLKVDPLVAGQFADFLAEAPAQEVARIRPLALARRLALPGDQVTQLCLQGAKDGMLTLLWDLLCPVCRIPSQVVDSLRALKDHGHCEACNLDYQLDFANSIELIFRAHPEIRDTDLGVFCIGGPAHSPHVVAQVRVAPGERISLDLRLTEGAYRVRGPQLPYSIDFRVEPGALESRWEVLLSQGPSGELARTLRPGGQAVVLTNDTDRELIARIERRAPRDDALTAARASALALFRELFPDQVLSQGQLINLETITLLVTSLEFSGDFYQALGDAKAFTVIHEQFRLADECIRRRGGAIVKTVNEGIVAAFTDPASAVDAALALRPTLSGNEVTRDLKLRVAVHRGPALVATLNEHLDYFGTTVSAAMRLHEHSTSEAPVISQSVAADLRVNRWVQLGGLSLDVIDVPATLVREGFAYRIKGKRKESSG
jgi:serine/threonine protein kinase/class 3 adenylate cyclase